MRLLSDNNRPGEARGRLSGLADELQEAVDELA